MSEPHRPDPASDQTPPDPLDAVLAAAFGPDSPRPAPPRPSVLKALAAGLPAVPRVQLRGPVTEAVTPVNLPGSAEVPPGPNPAGRLEVHGEIARGGMGAILKGRDIDLGRDLAVKVLLDSHKDHPEAVLRFLEEAQITGQLQHPGIAPVYELGQFPDQRPYFTMKLVKGQTLAALLHARRDLADDRPKFLGIFGQVCQTLAYAHARGVIHRDLKPLNVMVGAFGEVQVMDWGLAKVLAAGAAAGDPQTPEQTQVSAIRTQRSEQTPEEALWTHAGSVLGTPGYMAPEQARGDVELVDERADVFGLGGILCEVLTGQVPFPGKQAEALRRAATADLKDTLARLDACGADAELIALAKRCLAPEPWQRPRQAGEVAATVTAYEHSVAERLRQAELGRAAAEVKATEERKRRRVTLAFAAAVLLLVLVGGGGTAWWWTQRTAVVRDVEAALAEANGHEKEGRWAEARAALERAAGRLGGWGPAELRERVRQARADADMVAELETIRQVRESDIAGRGFDTAPANQAYTEAFRKYGIDIAALEPREAAARVRDSAIREFLLAGLDDWLRMKPDAEQARLRAVADAVDESTWRRSVRDALLAKDAQRMKELASKEEVLAQPPAVLDWLGEGLKEAELWEAAMALLRRADQRHPGDFWIDFHLATLHKDFGRPEQALGYARACVAIRPGSGTAHNVLGWELLMTKDEDGAIAELRQAFTVDPKMAMAHTNLGGILHSRGDLDGAIMEHRQAIAIDPRLALAYAHLGNALLTKGDLDGAIAVYRQGLAVHTKGIRYYNTVGSWLHGQLGVALWQKGDLNGAIAEYRQALTFNPKAKTWTHYLGQAERALALEPKLSAFLDGKLQPKDNDERLALAQLCKSKKLCHAAARLYAEAFAADPKLAADHLTNSYHYEAVCAAVRAGCGQGDDAAKLDDTERARWRKQALDWLRDCQVVLTNLLKSGKTEDRTRVQISLKYGWQRDPDMAGIRDPDDVAKLPADEQAACRKLWDDVTALLQKAGQGK